MLFLTTQEVLGIAERVIPGCAVRDVGLVEAAVARPQASFAGQRVYPDAVRMAAALVESLVCNHALVDGDKRLGLACLIVFLRLNGHRLTMTNDQAYDLIYAVASRMMRSVDVIAAALRPTVQDPS